MIRVDDMVIMSDPRMAFEYYMSRPYCKIISLDEDCEFLELSPSNNPDVVMGTVLLPPIEVKWAEIDGDEMEYNSLYFTYLSTGPVLDFITALIGYIHVKGPIIIYAPGFDSSGMDMDRGIQFLINHFANIYGISLGTINTPFQYNPSFLAPNLISIYLMNILSVNDFLIEYPLDIVIPQNIYNKIILDTNIYGTTLQERMEYVDLLRISSHSGKYKQFLHYV